MKPGSEEKQPWEEFVIAADFSDNMTAGSNLSLPDCSVLAVDNDGEDASTVIIDSTTLSIGLAADDEWGYLKVLVKGGTEANSPYKVTLRGKTNDAVPEKWEKDVIITVTDY